MKKNKLYTQEEKEMQIVQETTAFYGTSVGFTSIDDRSVFAIIDSINKGISFTAFENIIKNTVLRSKIGRSFYIFLIKPYLATKKNQKRLMLYSQSVLCK